MAAPTIWLVDDNEDLRYGVGMHLADCGFDVVEFGSSMEALDGLDAKWPVDLIITDLKLAKGEPTGITLARMARLRRPALPVVFLTGANDVDPGDIKGLGRLVMKPIDLDRLTAIIGEMLGDRREG